MPDYFTRIELHGGSPSDYDKLHEEMKNRGFFRAIRGHDGKTVRSLPTATYHKTAASGQSSAVKDQAVATAKATKRKAIVLCVESARWAGNFESP